MVGRAFTPSLHRKILALLGIFNCHNLFQFILEEGVGEVGSRPTRYVDFTEKQPFESGTQMSFSGTGMARIACADGVLNRALTRFAF